MSSKKQDLEYSVDSLLRAHAPTLWQGQGLLLGVSGGVDSMVLLDIVAHWHGKQKDAGPIHVAHVNYGLRGEESDADEALVREVSTTHGFTLHTHHMDQAAFPEGESSNDYAPSSGNLQAWAREVRMKFFGQVLREIQGCSVLLAHHQDDQLETILQRLFRGAGVESYQGLNASTSLPEFGLESVLRPFLTYSKQELEQVASEHGIPFRDDASNLTDSYARNVLRQTWIPTMDSMFPGWKKNLHQLGDASRTVKALADTIMVHVVNNGELMREPWLALPSDIQPFILHKWIRSQGAQPSASVIQSLMKSLGSTQPGKTLDVSSQSSVEVTKDGFKILNNAEEADMFDSHVWQLTCVDGGFERITKSPGVVLQGVLHAKESVDSFTIRPPKQGDLIQPFGMKEGHQAVVDFLANRGITGSSKSQAAVVVDAKGEIVAVCYPPQFASRVGAIGEISNTRRVPEIDGDQGSYVRIELASQDPWAVSYAESDGPIEMAGMKFRPMIVEDDIQQRIRVLASKIRKDAMDWGVSQENPLHIITVLQGAVPFSWDLTRELRIPCVFDTVHLSSYKGGMSSTGEIEKKSWLTSPIQGQHVLVIEDIVDTGRTLDMFTKELMKLAPASVRIAALCRKKEAMEVDLDVDYVGFDLAPDFVLGYGMDVNELGRNLRHIYVKMA